MPHEVFFGTWRKSSKSLTVQQFRTHDAERMCEYHNIIEFSCLESPVGANLVICTALELDVVNCMLSREDRTSIQNTLTFVDFTKTCGPVGQCTGVMLGRLARARVRKGWEEGIFFFLVLLLLPTQRNCQHAVIWQESCCACVVTPPLCLSSRAKPARPGNTIHAFFEVNEKKQTTLPCGGTALLSGVRGRCATKWVVEWENSYFGVA